MIPTDDQLEIVRVLLGAGIGLANVAVWYGVYLEREHSPQEAQERGWRILVRGLAAEVALTFILLFVDTTLSVRQRSEIIALEKAAAPRNIRGDEFRKIATAIEKFRDTKYDLSVPPITNHGFASSLIEPGSYLVHQIIVALRLGHWKLLSIEGSVPKAELPWEYAGAEVDPTAIPPSGTTVPVILVGQVSNVVGVRVSVNFRQNPELVDAATALSNALDDIGIKAERVIAGDDNQMTPHAVHVIIGIKP